MGVAAVQDRAGTPSPPPATQQQPGEDARVVCAMVPADGARVETSVRGETPDREAMVVHGLR